VAVVRLSRECLGGTTTSSVNISEKFRLGVEVERERVIRLLETVLTGVLSSCMLL